MKVSGSSRTTVNQKSSRIIKEYIEKHHIQLCEACGGSKCHNKFMQVAHRHKRRFYYSRPVRALWDRNQWLYLGNMCHFAIEFDAEATEKLFFYKLGKDLYA